MMPFWPKSGIQHWVLNSVNVLSNVINIYLGCHEVLFKLESQGIETVFHFRQLEGFGTFQLRFLLLLFVSLYNDLFIWS